MVTEKTFIGMLLGRIVKEIVFSKNVRSTTLRGVNSRRGFISIFYRVCKRVSTYF